MKKKRYGFNSTTSTDIQSAAPKTTKIEAFSFGDPTPVLNKSSILDYIECWKNGKYYNPPISFDGLAKSFRASVHHSSPIYVKRNLLSATFIPHKLLSRENFARFVLDQLIFGNSYLEHIKNRLGGNYGLKPALAKYVRRGVDNLNQYFYAQGHAKDHEFHEGSIFHLIEADINQEIYGLPEYLSALHSAWLNESATLFRRKYYENGSHAGFILYMTDAAQNQDDVDAMRKALRDSKGPGNFRNVFMYAPNGKKDGLQILPVSEVAAKDEFFNIKSVTRDDMLAAHRVPPQLLGIVPNNTGGFGAVEPAAKVFVQNELEPLQARFMQLNEWIGEEVIKFNPYGLAEAGDSK
ncbi:phage portal protein [Undibacterium danionis]|uniref:Phage portal protein n=1 Tax=Undibacterium danionis TaxID=1812100 RepID=A0ABV6ILD5_9BURK